MSGPEKAVLASEAGADVVLNYKTDDLPSAISDVTQGQGVDRIVEVDLAANISTDIAILQPDGEVIVYGSGASEIGVPFSPGDTQRCSYVFFHCVQFELCCSRCCKRRFTEVIGGELLEP